MTTLLHFTPDVELYSIDEAFLDFSNLYKTDVQKHARKLCKTVAQWTGIPIAVGIASTKTLAKLASRLNKKWKEKQGVVLLLNQQDIEEALKITAVGDVWGIGRRNTCKLNALGIHTAWDLSQASDAFVKKHLTVVGLRTARELRGEACLELGLTPPARQTICTSRSFGQPVTSLYHVKEATASYASSCAAKLRQQKSCASILTVFLQAYPNQHDPAYYNSRTVMLPVATNSTLELVHYVNIALQSIYKHNYRYKKSGVIVSDLCPEGSTQMPLLDNIDRNKHQRLMEVLDKVNSRWGKGTIVSAEQGVYANEELNPWKMRCVKRSPRYTTYIEEIPVVNC